MVTEKSCTWSQDLKTWEQSVSSSSRTTLCSLRESEYHQHWLFPSNSRTWRELFLIPVYWSVFRCVNLSPRADYSTTFIISDSARLLCSYSMSLGFGSSYTLLIPSTFTFGPDVSPRNAAVTEIKKLKGVKSLWFYGSQGCQVGYSGGSCKEHKKFSSVSSYLICKWLEDFLFSLFKDADSALKSQYVNELLAFVTGEFLFVTAI